jgi:hypothetical protein
MSCFTETRVLASGAPDPTKHVNFVRGMILGEDEFKQEFAWLSGRDQWLARDLIGYGTVRGLKVRVEPDGAAGPRIYVHPGAALTPAGQLVCVPSPQCAHLNDWLRKNADEVQRAVTSPPQNPLSLYVVLCYRECPTDTVPIPGEPCRSEDELVKPSRLRDDFALEISLTPPVHREESALRDFCLILREIETTDGPVTSPALGDFLDWLRGRAAPGSPPASPPASPPGSPPGAMRVRRADAPEYLRAAFHLWTTELRPKWFARWYGCAAEEKHAAALEDCVLLSAIEVALIFDSATGAYQVASSQEPVIRDAERPYLLHLRMLQEWLLYGRAGESTAAAPADLAGDAQGPITSNAVNKVRGIDVITTGASPGHVLRYRAGPARWQPEAFPTIPTAATSVTAETAFGMASSVGTSTAYARANHTHGTPLLPDLIGDANGPIISNTVTSIRGVNVITTGAATDMLLGFDGTSWRPVAAPTATGQFVGRGAAAGYAIVAAGAFAFRLVPGDGANTQITGTPVSAYNGLASVARDTGDPIDTYYFTFNGLPATGAEKRYVVKLTPWWTSESKNGFMLYFAGFFRIGKTTRGRFAVKAVGEPTATAYVGNLMIEVSEIQG